MQHNDVPNPMQQAQVAQGQMAVRPNWKTWQSDDDIPQRRKLIHQILLLFQQRKPSVTREWQQKLPDFVQRLEEALYRTAASKEEYSDYSTLETRLQQVARKMVNRNPNQAGGSGQAGQGQNQQGGQNMQGMQMQQMQQMGMGGMGGGVAGQAGANQLSQQQQQLLQQQQQQKLLLQQQQQQQMQQQQGGSMQISMGNNGMQGQLISMSGQMMPQQGQQMQQGQQPMMGSNLSQQQQQMQMMQMQQGNRMSTNGGQMQGGHMMPQQQQQQQQMRMQQQQAGSSGQMQMQGGGMQPGGAGQAANRSMGGQNPAMGSSVGNASGGAGGDGGAGSGQQHNDQQRQYIGKQQRWLLLLRHASKCTVPAGTCSATPHCQVAKSLVHHVTQCQDANCVYPRCVAARDLLRHHMRCQDQACVICTPVREYMSRQKGVVMQRQNQQQNQQRAALQQQQQQHMQQQQMQGGQQMMMQQQMMQQPNNNLPAMVPTNMQGSGMGSSSMGGAVSTMVPTDVFSGQPSHADTSSQVPAMVPNPGGAAVHAKPEVAQKPAKRARRESKAVTAAAAAAAAAEEAKVGAGVSRMVPVPGQTDGELKPDLKMGMMPAMGGAQSSTNTKMGTVQGGAPQPAQPPKPSEGTSLLETFTPAQVESHLSGLRNWANVFTQQNQAKRGKEATTALMAATGSGRVENQCKSCGLERLLFEPPPLYCGTCGVRIKRNQVHYVATPPQAASSGAGEVTKHLCCVPCYNEIKGDTIELEGGVLPKTALEKRKNDEEQLEEAWVECDKCFSWHHQICVLFNGRRNEGEKTVFHCPLCIKKDMASGLRKTVTMRPQAQQPAEALPRTKLSDFLEQRLKLSLQRERDERARRMEKPVEDIETAEGLSVRLVSNIDKKLETRARFCDSFPHFPTEFPYKSKVLLLFQRLDGADVCLFSMYMQEYGADAPAPNTRRVYLSYLDSIKYFRPEVSSSRGTALRTYVYHELLVGYLQYVKVRGFTSIYIWACPPLAGEDYILYCHPQKQKTPKSDKLRAWYQNMLQQAKAEKIVTHIGTMHDTFFQAGREKETRSAAQMPYFDGDYWPGSADDLLAQIDTDKLAGKDGKRGKAQETGSTQRGVAQAKHKAGGKANARGKTLGSGGVGTSRLAAFDAALMSKLEEVLGGAMKEDFIIAHLHHCCTHCGNYIHKGNRWFVGEDGPHIELCEGCYRADLQRPPYDRVTYPLQCEEVKELRDTRDPDDTVESEFFDTRQAFLSLCQGNHFQFDTLRRAKHSSMMVLYHLHNPAEPAFVSTCNVCQAEIAAGSGWRCTVCNDFDMCDKCNQTEKHPHEMKPHSRDGSSGVVGRGPRGAPLTEEEKKQRMQHLQRTMALLVHASACNQQNCSTPDCHKVKTLFKHGVDCPKKAAGGCHCCRRVCTLLHVHAKSCKVSNCPVPRCRELKEYRRRLQTQMEDRRRQNAMAMYRGQQNPGGNTPA